MSTTSTLPYTILLEVSLIDRMYFYMKQKRFLKNHMCSYTIILKEPVYSTSYIQGDFISP